MTVEENSYSCPSCFDDLVTKKYNTLYVPVDVYRKENM